MPRSARHCKIGCSTGARLANYGTVPRDGETVPRLLTINQLADALRGDADFVAVARLLAVHLEMRDADLAAILKAAVTDEHVPYLAAFRYKDSGLRKRDEWESVWRKQREEDVTDNDSTLRCRSTPRPTSPSRLTGVTEASSMCRRSASSPTQARILMVMVLCCWAGRLDHAEQADALSALVTERTEIDSWPTERIAPLLAGLVEVMPWVWQWHNVDDRDFGSSPAEDFQAFLDDQRQRHGVTEEELRQWRPTAVRGGGRKRVS